MKRFAAITIFTLGILAAGNAVAQQLTVRANVPFSFTVGNKILPAGAYSISAVSDVGIEIRNMDRQFAILAVAPNTAEESKNGNVLVFERHGDLYMLRDVLCESAAMNRSLIVKRWKKNAYLQEAMNAPSDGTVMIPTGN